MELEEALDLETRFANYDTTEARLGQPAEHIEA